MNDQHAEAAASLGGRFSFALAEKRAGSVGRRKGARSPPIPRAFMPRHVVQG
jgi:hypothetical protein